MVSFRFRTDQIAFRCSGFNWSPSHSDSLKLNEIAASISSAVRFCIALTCTRECGFVCMGALTHTLRTQLTRNIASDYITRLPHRSVPGPSLSLRFPRPLFSVYYIILESGGSRLRRLFAFRRVRY